MRNKFHPSVGSAGIRRACASILLRLPVHISLKGEAMVGKGFRYVMKLDSLFLHFLALRHSPSNLSHSSVRPQNSVQQSKLIR